MWKAMTGKWTRTLCWIHWIANNSVSCYRCLYRSSCFVFESQRVDCMKLYGNFYKRHHNELIKAARRQVFSEVLVWISAKWHSNLLLIFWNITQWHWNYVYYWFIHSLICMRISSQWELSKDRIKPVPKHELISARESATALIRMSNAHVIPRINAASARSILVAGDHTKYNLMWMRLFW